MTASITTSFRAAAERQSRYFSHSVPNFVKLVEVGPRDGLQNEKVFIPTEVKLSLVHKLTRAGIRHIEVTSFVHPKWVPQLADGAALFRQIKRERTARYSVLVPNLQGMISALDVKPDEVAVFAAATESFSKRNINCSIDESITRFDEIIKLAREHRIPVRGYVSCVLGCPYEGTVSPDAVARVVDMLWKRGCYEISLGDTIGSGTPDSMNALLSVILHSGGVCPREAIAVHCHETHGRALDNIDVALDIHGIRVVDSAIGGLGGCPYAGPGAPGNVATELVVSHLLNKGYRFDSTIDLHALKEIGTWIRSVLRNLTPS